MSSQIFESVYSCFDNARLACAEQNSNKSYPIEIWKKRQLGYLEVASVRAPRQESLTRILDNYEIDQVLDFGGGSGWLFRFLRNAGYRISSQIIGETEDTISWFRRFNPEIIWMDNLSLRKFEVCEKNSLLYSNSCIQYLGDLESDFFDLLTKPWEGYYS